MGAVLLRVIEGHTLFQVFISKDQLSHSTLAIFPATR
jgi:hypothetical protein